ncbi:hypothetical protein [Ornithinibacillus halophilus]|uniref:Glycine zipper-like domain-containing protein n=1 Tax=Ornithinibacillus halophilus TaxID=930117 RepID=A0A1M5FFJ3_9BACI|nr:hypothetical protein [Ornithinibacillus halophilus]SHF90310.1 hypothetical protein SAMN05216225_100869 [Ornithinibacillus halophilus]
MESQRVENMYTILDEMSKNENKTIVAKLDVDRCKRVIQRLDSFSSDCEECEEHFVDLESHLMELHEKVDHLDEDDLKKHGQKLENISSHLKNQHKLVTSGYYMSIFISIGTSLGLVFGLVLFDNLALGLPIGMSVGLAIGVMLDENAKKKGMTL